MSKLVVNLPLDETAASGGALRWLLQKVESENADNVVSPRPRRSDGVEIGFEDASIQRVSYVPGASTNTANSVEIVSSLHLQPSTQDRIVSFLTTHQSTLDHIGLNLSHRDIDETNWARLVETIGARLPLYRLEIGSPNDILLAVQTDPKTGDMHVLELVRDQSAAQTSLHFCLRIAASRKIIETEFPAPFGGYKPGDEPFFRSVALLPELIMPAYLDFAFEDGGMTPWPQIVAAMGKRIS